jgi:hypothetical protein
MDHQMFPSFSDLEQRRVLAQRIAAFGDLRPGSITGTSSRGGKTISAALITHAAIQKAGREVPEFRQFQQRTREFLGTNAEIWCLRPLEEEAVKELKKDGRSVKTKDHPRRRAVLAGVVPGSAQHGAH